LVNAGAARWYRLEPGDTIRRIGIGNGTTFKIWVIARPLPREDQWHWKFSARNLSNVQGREPGDINLTVSGEVATLSIRSVTIYHYGNYSVWAANSYGGWKEGELTFTLLPKGKTEVSI